MFVSGSTDLCLYNVCGEGVESFVVPPCTKSKILDVSFCNENSFMAVLREHEKPQIYSLKDKTKIRIVQKVNLMDITAIAFKRRTKKIIAMGDTSGNVVFYDTSLKMVSERFDGIVQSVQNLEFSFDDHQLCGLDNAVLFVFPEISKSASAKRFKLKAPGAVLKCHPFIKSRVGLGYLNGAVGIWDVQVGAEIIHLELLPGAVTGVSMSSCGNYLISVGPTLKICEMDVEQNLCKFIWQLDQEEEVTAMDVSSDDKYLGVGLKDGTIKLYNIKDNLKLIVVTRTQSSPINIFRFENREKQANTNFSSLSKLCENEEFSQIELFKKKLLKKVKTEIDNLEKQLSLECLKLQQFLDNEFHALETVMNNKWGVFRLGDVNSIVEGIYSEKVSKK